MSSRGFAFIIALVFLVLGTLIGSMIIAAASTNSAAVREDSESHASKKAAEIGIRVAIERLGQKACESYFSDPVESFYWNGGDLPDNAQDSETADGVLANDGEVFGMDTGLDGLPDLLEPSFHIDGDTLPEDWRGYRPGSDNRDPGADDFVENSSAVSQPDPFLRLEGNGIYDIPSFRCQNPPGNGQLQVMGGPCLVGIPDHGSSAPGPLRWLGNSDHATGADGISSFFEQSQGYLYGESNPQEKERSGYHPLVNCDPAGDDYHPILNPLGEEGRVLKLDGSFPGPTVENPETRWRHSIQKAGSVASFSEAQLDGYYSVRAVDTSSRIDLNGPSLLTARLLNSLIQMTGTSPGPVTASNPPLGRNGRGIESIHKIVIPNLGNLPADSVLDYPQFFLFPNPAFKPFGQFLNLQPSPSDGVPPIKIAATQQQETLYFGQEPNYMDPDAIVILKYRDRALGGRFASLSQLLDVRRADGSAIFDDRDRDELLRLSQFLSIEAWRDPNASSRRNGEPLGVWATDPNFPYEPYLGWAGQKSSYLVPQPWQDIHANGIPERGESFPDSGLTVPDAIVLNSDVLNNDPPLPCWQIEINGTTYQADCSGGDLEVNDGAVAIGAGNGDVSSVQLLQLHLKTNYRGHYRVRLAHSFQDERDPANPFARIVHVSDWIWDREGTDLTNGDITQRWRDNEIDFDKSANVPPGFDFDFSPTFTQSYGNGVYHPTVEGRWFVDVVADTPCDTSIWNRENSYDSTWNPFFVREFRGKTKNWRVRSERYGVNGWSPFESRFYSRHALPHRHSSYNFPFTNFTSTTFENPYSAFAQNHAIDNDPILFNFDATAGNGVFDVDPYVNLFEPDDSFRNSLPPPPPLTGLDWQNWGSGIMFSEGLLWSVSYLNSNYDVGSDQSYSYPGPEAPSIEFYSRWHPRRPDDPNQDDFDPASAIKNSPGCNPAGFWGMRNEGGSERSKHLDPYPELGRSLYFDMPTTWQGLYQDCFDDPNCDPNLFQRPNFSPLPVLDAMASEMGAAGELKPAFWTLPNADWFAIQANWFAEPGEPYKDDGRDGLPNTGDPGEGNGRWDPGESFSDYGLDGIPDRLEQAFGDENLTTVLSNCALLGQSDEAGDYHSDNLRWIGGVPRGSEGNGLFDLLREPYLGRVSPATLSPMFRPDPQNTPYFFDLNEDGVYDHGVFREARAPVNLNAAPEEVLAAVLYQGILMPAKKKQDRFLWSAIDSAKGDTNSGDPGQNPQDDGMPSDYDWNSSITPKFSLVLAKTSDTKFAYHLARGIARAIFLRRLGLYSSTSGDPQRSSDLGSGAFRSWQEFERFLKALLLNEEETARFASGNAKTLHSHAVDLQGNPIADAFSLGSVNSYPGGAPAARQMILEKILAQANPNGSLEASGSAGFQLKNRFDKTDFPFPTTEFCLGPTGVYEITAVGYSASSGSIDAENFSYNQIRAREEIQRTVKVFEHIKLSSKNDFAKSEATSRGVAILPKVDDPAELNLDASATLSETSGPSDWNSPFLLVRPKVCCFDPDRGLFFAASNSSSAPFGGPGFDNQSDDPGASIQVLEFVGGQNGKPESLENFSRNNGLSRYITHALTGKQFQIGLIEPGNGIGNPAPQVAAMAFDSRFPVPRSFPSTAFYLGRLYFLDDSLARLRAVDIGKDGDGGLVSGELSFASDLSYPAQGQGISICLLPQRRELFVSIGAGATVQVGRYRYPEAPDFPATASDGKSILQPIGTQSLPFDPRLYVGVVKDELTGYLYFGGNQKAAGFPSAPQASIYRLRGDAAMSLDQVFPWTAGFSPPGYSPVTALSASSGCELVGLEIDPGSGLLFALWNNKFSLYPKWPGAYLAAIPVGTASYLTHPLVNPFPVELTKRDPANAATLDDSQTIFAAAMSLNAKNKTILVAPREQLCSSANPFTGAKNALRVLSYQGDGLRTVDLLQSSRLWTDSWGGAAWPSPMRMFSFPERDLFFLPIATNQVTRSNSTPCVFGSPCQCDEDLNFQSNQWEVTRSIKLLKFRAISFSTGADPNPWEDGKLVARANAIPLSEYLDPTDPTMIYARANFENGRFFTGSQYKLDDPNQGVSGPKSPVSMRSSFCTQTNAVIRGEGITVDEKTPQTSSSSLACDPPKDANGMTFSSLIPVQSYVYPQDGVGELRVLSRPKDGINERNVNNGWRILEGGAEFWIRFGDLSKLDTSIFNDPKQQLVLYENLAKAKTPLATGLNPFLPSGREKESLFNILTAGEILLGHPPALPQGKTAGDIQSFKFCPDSMEVWAFDLIALESIVKDPVTGLLKANLVYERRLAGPAGQYPSIYHNYGWPENQQITTPWGAFEGCPGFAFANGATSGQLAEGFTTVFEPASAQTLKGLNLGNSFERMKYARVQIDWGGSTITDHRFVPIYGAGPLSSNRQAAIRVSAPDIPIRSDRWVRVAFASKVDFDPTDVGTALMRPSVEPDETMLHVWTESGLQSGLGASPIDDASDLNRNPSWWDFPSDRDGYLAFGAYEDPFTIETTDSTGVLHSCSQPRNAPRNGGSVVPGFSYTVDDIVFYERPDPVLEVPNTVAGSSIARFELGEGGWPLGVSSAFPGGEFAAAPFSPGEPFFDLNGDGIREDSKDVATWDFNHNRRWDFGEPVALPGDPPSAEIVPNLWEPFDDLNHNGAWDSSGDLFEDLNQNGVLDGEAFIDSNGNGVWDPGETFDDLNNNTCFNGGEPYVDLNGNRKYDSRYGESFTNNTQNAQGSFGWNSGDTFLDENRNGRWDAGEPFTSWSRQTSPQSGELYRENGIDPGYQPASPAFPGAGSSYGDNLLPDWNNDGRYDASGMFEGSVPFTIPAGARLGSVSLTVWDAARDPGAADAQAKASVDLQIDSKDGRLLGRWVGADRAEGQQAADESGVGLPISTESRLRFRIHFLTPNPSLTPGSVTAASTLPGCSPVLDDISFTVVLPAQAQTIYENKVLNDRLVYEYERNNPVR